jgi:hypothetical protein
VETHPWPHLDRRQERGDVWGGHHRLLLLEAPTSFVEFIIYALRACANRWATFRTWQLLEGLYSLLTIAWHIRYSPIGAAS